MVGLEFVDVQYNADKLWRKRKYYRKKQDVSGILINNDIRCDITTVDMSVDGFMVKLTGNAGQLEKGIIVKLILAALNLKAVAKIIWIRKDLDNSEILMGLRYLEVD
jgi:c-di-GMP-binding flagellar brake protein YcgR